jgi:RNA polymerase sigma factor (sigma-70 family)
VTPEDEKGKLKAQLVRLDAKPWLAALFEDPNALAAYHAIDNHLASECLAIVARQRLSSREFEVFDLRWHGYKQNEIAVRLGISKGRVSQLLSQVREKLADIA